MASASSTLPGTFGVSFRGNATRSDLRRTKALAVKVLEAAGLCADPGAVVVRETRCLDEGCPDLETTVLVLSPPAQASLTLRLQRPVAEVQESDIKAAVAEALRSTSDRSVEERDHAAAESPENGAATCSCCENNWDRQLEGCGCCGWRFLEDDNVRVHMETGQRVVVGAGNFNDDDEASSSAFSSSSSSTSPSDRTLSAHQPAEATASTAASATPASDVAAASPGEIDGENPASRSLLEDRVSSPRLEDGRMVCLQVSSLFGKTWTVRVRCA